MQSRINSDRIIGAYDHKSRTRVNAKPGMPVGRAGRAVMASPFVMAPIVMARLARATYRGRVLEWVARTSRPLSRRPGHEEAGKADRERPACADRWTKNPPPA
jgi:hypothetical protein